MWVISGTLCKSETIRKTLKDAQLPSIDSWNHPPIPLDDLLLTDTEEVTDTEYQELVKKSNTELDTL